MESFKSIMTTMIALTGYVVPADSGAVKRHQECLSRIHTVGKMDEKKEKLRNRVVMEMMQTLCYLTHVLSNLVSRTSSVFSRVQNRKNNWREYW